MACIDFNTLPDFAGEHLQVILAHRFPGSTQRHKAYPNRMISMTERHGLYALERHPAIDFGLIQNVGPGGDKGCAGLQISLNQRQARLEDGACQAC